MYRLDLADAATCVRIYVENQEIGSKEIRELFGPIGSSTIARLKKDALKLMAEKKVIRFASHKVNTEAAFEAWGIDIVDLKRRFKELQKLKLSLSSEE